MTFIVFIRKNATGEVRKHKDESPWDETSDFMWSEGNYGCDCNRFLFFERAGGGEPGSAVCGDTAYSVRIEDEGGQELYCDKGWSEQ